MDAITEKALRAFNKKPWHEDNQCALMNFLDASEWSLVRFNHAFVGKPSGYDLQPINSLEIILFIKVWEDEVQFEVSAELSKFTRVGSATK